MEDLTTVSVTDVVLDQFAKTADPRLREIMASLVRHLHAFAREVELTPDEWLKAIAFLTQVGQTCSPTRQEFILLSDVLGLSALVNLLRDKTAPGEGTESSLLGPFYRAGAPELALGDSIAAVANGPPLLVQGAVVDGTGNPVPHARIQVWQTDAEGAYDLQVHGDARADMRGNFRADEAGRFHFRTLRPLGYSIPMDGPVGALIRAQSRHGCRPAHIHFLIGAPGYRELVTALYLADDPYLASDTVFGVSNGLIVTPRGGDGDEPPTVSYEFRLHAEQPGHEGGRVGADPAQIPTAG